LLRPRSIQNTLDAILERANIEHKSTHIFRHTFASKLFAKGYDVRLVSELLGHSSVSTTYNTYIHLIKQQKARAMTAIEDMYDI
jgi:site-specific recombinase XerD